jgi:hypothetical protein
MLVDDGRRMYKQTFGWKASFKHTFGSPKYIRNINIEIHLGETCSYLLN